MASGRNRLVINSRERAVSSDINRLQTLKDTAAQQVLRRLWSDTVGWYGQTQGVTTPLSGVGTPLAGVVLAGLLVVPSTSTLVVDAGTLVAINSTVASESGESPFVYVDDPGLSAPISFTSNAGPGIRIDVVEVSIVDTILTSSARDVFNPSTGLFAAASVAKEAAARLSYRLRLGTQGAGYPGHASGWLPLAVVITPAAAANFDGCTFYDVRPLISDRWTPNGANVTTFGPPAHGGPRGKASIQAPGGVETLEGFIEAQGQPLATTSEFGPYLVGGRMRKSTPTATMGTGDVEFIDLQPSGDLASGTILNNKPTVVAAFFPHGLPRWVRYAELAATTGGVRRPWGPRGIILGTNGDTGVEATGWLQRTMPASLGITGNQPGRVILGSIGTTGNQFAPTTFVDGWCEWLQPTATITGVSVVAGNQDYDADAATVLACAHRLKLQFLASYTSFTGPVASAELILLRDPSANNIQSVQELSETITAVSSNYIYRRTVLTNLLRDNYPAAPSVSRFRYSQATGGGSLVTGTCIVMGWQI